MISLFSKYFKRNEPKVPEAHLTVKYTKVDNGEASTGQQKVRIIGQDVDSGEGLAAEFENCSLVESATLDVDTENCKISNAAKGEANGASGYGSTLKSTGNSKDVERTAAKKKMDEQATNNAMMAGERKLAVRAQRSLRPIHQDQDDLWMSETGLSRSYLTLLARSGHPEVAPPVESFTPFFPPQTRPKDFSALIGSPSPVQYSGASGNSKTIQHAEDERQGPEPWDTAEIGFHEIDLQ